MKRVLGIVALVSCIWVLAPALAIGQSIADRAITNITGDLYLVQDGSQYTVFLVTPNGIILGDPLFLTTAKWLKDELAARFPNRPVRYVLHTSPNFERAAGAEVFKPAQVVAQEEFVREVTAAYSSLPREYANLDRNGNGILERTEFAGTPAEPVFAVRDLDSDGNVTRQELYGLIAVGLVTSTYLADRTITLDGRSVELVHPGRTRTADAAVLYLPAERVLFTGDMVALQSLPETVGRYSLGRVHCGPSHDRRTRLRHADYRPGRTRYSRRHCRVQDVPSRLCSRACGRRVSEVRVWSRCRGRCD